MVSAVLALVLAQMQPVPSSAAPSPVASAPPVVPVNPASPAAQPLPGGTIRPAGTPSDPSLAVIVNSGSTNSAGYTLRVRDNGWTTLEHGGIAQRKRVARDLVARFFADLRAVGPLGGLPRALCMKSVSFGSVTTIAYGGATSPDLSCPSTGAQHALALDADALRDAVGVVPLRPRRALTP